MSFRTEGTIEVTIVEANVCECKFQPKQGEVNNRNEYVQCIYDIELLLQDANGNNDIWRGEMSTRTGMGTRADKYRYELTLETLREIGFNVQTMQDLEMQFQPAEDRSTYIPNLIGLRCKAVTENKVFTRNDGTEGHRIYVKYLNGLNSDAGGKRLNFDQFLAARRGAAPAAPAAPAPLPAPAPVPAPPAPTPAPGYPQGYQTAPVTPPPAPAVPAAPKPGCPY